MVCKCYEAISAGVKQNGSPTLEGIVVSKSLRKCVLVLRNAINLLNIASELAKYSYFLTLSRNNTHFGVRQQYYRIRTEVFKLDVIPAPLSGRYLFACFAFNYTA